MFRDVTCIFCQDLDYRENEEYEYKMAREYNWNVKSKQSKGYEENYFFLFRYKSPIITSEKKLEIFCGNR